MHLRRIVRGNAIIDGAGLVKTPERFMVQAVREFCAENDLRLEVMSQGWLLKVWAPGLTRLIFGYDIGLNTSVSQQIASDKSATYDILSNAGISAIEHRLFHSPAMKTYVDDGGNWRSMLDYFYECGNDVVCKSHAGTGGSAVYRAETPLELEGCVQALFTGGRALTISPYVEIADEYRVVVLDGTAELVYSKERPFIIGDGASTVTDLLSQQPKGIVIGMKAPKAWLDLDRVPVIGEKVLIEWRHNLAHGAAPIVLTGDDVAPVVDLATRGANALGIRFASVDIAATNGLQVLEVNSGVMMESFAASSSVNHKTALSIYATALRAVVER